MENGGKYASFLDSDFNDPKKQKVACKNGMALLSKGKNWLACAFMILGKDILTAVDVALQQCRDPMLAMMITRLCDPTNEKKQMERIATKYYFDRGVTLNDPYLRSIG